MMFLTMKHLNSNPKREDLMRYKTELLKLKNKNVSDEVILKLLDDDEKKRENIDIDEILEIINEEDIINMPDHNLIKKMADKKEHEKKQRDKVEDKIEIAKSMSKNGEYSLALKKYDELIIEIKSARNMDLGG